MSLRSARTAFGWRAAQQAGVQLIYFARLLILARLLAPEAFGLLAIAMIAVSVLMSLSDLGVIPALVQRSSATADEQDTAWTVGLVRSVGAAAVLIVTAPLVAHLFGDARATPVIQLLAVRPVIDALRSIGIARLTREFRFRELALVHVPGALIDAIAAISLAQTWGVWALVAGALTGALASTVLSYVFAPHRPRLRFSVGSALPLIRFGRWVLGTSVLGLLATSGLQLVVSRGLGVSELGLYFLAAKVAFLPADAMRGVVGSVAFPLYASLQEDRAGTARSFRSLLIAQALLLLPIYALLIVLAPSFADALGPRWSGTTPLIRLISAAAVMGLYADSVMPLLLGRGKPDRVMAIVAVQTAVLLAVIMPMVTRFGAAGAAAAWLPAYGGAQLASLIFARTELGSTFAGSMPHLSAVVAVAGLCGGTAALVQGWLSGTAALVTGSLCGLLAAGILLAALIRTTHLAIPDLIGTAGTRDVHLAGVPR